MPEQISYRRQTGRTIMLPEINTRCFLCTSSPPHLSNCLHYQIKYHLKIISQDSYTALDSLKKATGYTVDKDFHMQIKPTFNFKSNSLSKLKSKIGFSRHFCFLLKAMRINISFLNPVSTTVWINHTWLSSKLVCACCVYRLQLYFLFCDPYHCQLCSQILLEQRVETQYIWVNERWKYSLLIRFILRLLPVSSQPIFSSQRYTDILADSALSCIITYWCLFSIGQLLAHDSVSGRGLSCLFSVKPVL